jgi:hypothetical protein
MSKQNFDTALRRKNAALCFCKRFGYTSTVHEDRIVAVKKSEYKRIEGEIKIEYFFEESKVRTTLQHEKKGQTTLERFDITRKMLKTCFSYPRAHLGTEYKYIK